jgi:glucose/arabinose dehydrogenase
LVYLFFRFLFLSFVILLLAACGVNTTLVPLTTTPTSLQTQVISPTEAPIFPTASPMPVLVTATIEPAHTPTIIPETEQPILPQFPERVQAKWELITGGLNSPIGLANARDGSERLFVIEQAGRIRVLENRELLDNVFLDIREKISCCGERGLLGLAFHPQYDVNGYFYVNYTDLNGDTVISRFEVSEDRAKADPASELQLLFIEQPFGNHNGGGMAFGSDGYLYLALGDGGSGGDPMGNAQNTNSLLGKLLRIDVNQPAGYSVPRDNPFTDGGGAPEVWAFGLRNPWRFSFDRLTGDLYIGDVGQGSWEEIDYLPAGHPGGANFGWNYREGSQPYLTVSIPSDLSLIDPVSEYGRDQGFSVIGGLVYRGEQLPELNGIYLYGDYGSGFIWGLYRDAEGSWHNRILFETSSSITSFGEDENGELYYVSQSGELYQLVRE